MKNKFKQLLCKHKKYKVMRDSEPVAINKDYFGRLKILHKYKIKCVNCSKQSIVRAYSVHELLEEDAIIGFVDEG